VTPFNNLMQTFVQRCGIGGSQETRLRRFRLDQGQRVLGSIFLID